MYLIMFLCLLVFTQETLYSVIGLSGGILFVARATADLLSISLLLFFVIRRTAEGKTIPLSGIGYERIFLAFLLYSLTISFLVTRSNLFVNLSEVLVLNRFVFLAMAIPLFITSRAQIEKIMRFIWLMIVVQIIFGMLQAVGGPAIIERFAPSDYTNFLSGVERSFTSNRELSRRMLIGSMGDFISFGYVLLFGVVLWISSGKHGLWTPIILGLMLVLIFLSGSRAIFLVGFLTASFYLLRNSRVIVRTLFILALIPAIPYGYITLVSNATSVEFDYSNFISIFSSQFVENLLNQRLGLVVFFLPELFLDPAILTGLSPDREYVTNYSFEHFDSVPYILNAVMVDVLEDFYLAALLAYYGIFGTILFYMIQYRIFAKAYSTRNSTEPLLRRMSYLVMYGVFVVNFLSFANQSFENRGLSFLIWSFIGLYAVALRLHARDQRTEEFRERVQDQPDFGQPGNIITPMRR
jgi:hypothetical protein